VVTIGNDGNRYVDTVFAGQLRAGFGTPLQFFGSLGPTVPTLGAALLNPAVPNTLPALTAAYGALAPLVGCFRAQAGTAPAGACVIPGYPSPRRSPASPRSRRARFRARCPARATARTISASRPTPSRCSRTTSST
jgi:hypothetical protein